MKAFSMKLFFSVVAGCFNKKARPRAASPPLRAYSPNAERYSSSKFAGVLLLRFVAVFMLEPRLASPPKRARHHFPGSDVLTSGPPLFAGIPARKDLRQSHRESHP